MHSVGNDGPFQLVDRLKARGVECVIIGGLAVNYYGYVRATEDIDLIFRRTAATEQALWETLRDFSAFWITDQIDPVTGLEKTEPVTLEYVRTHGLMMLGTRVGYVDLFDFLPGLEGTDMQNFFDTAVTAAGRKFVSLEWLKRLKVAANRPQDRIDLEHLP